MIRILVIMLTVTVLGLGTAACGKKGDPRLTGASDGFPAGYPYGAPRKSDNIFQKPGPQ